MFLAEPGRMSLCVIFEKNILKGSLRVGHANRGGDSGAISEERGKEKRSKDN